MRKFTFKFAALFIILHVDVDYTETIIAHPSRDYAWIMCRQPEISESDFERLMTKLEAVGYDLEVVQRLPQDWSGEAARLEELKAADL